MRLLLVWGLNAIALWLVTRIVPGVHLTNDVVGALLAVLLLGLANTLVKPLLVLLTLPITILTLGLFLLVLNGLMFWGVDKLGVGLQVDAFGTAMIGAIAYSVISWILSRLLPGRS